MHSSHFRELAGGILRISADEIYKRCYATFILFLFIFLSIVHIKGQSVMRLKVRKLISTKRTHRVNAI